MSSPILPSRSIKQDEDGTRIMLITCMVDRTVLRILPQAHPLIRTQRGNSTGLIPETP
jgi:hypothetical protein